MHFCHRAIHVFVTLSLHVAIFVTFFVVTFVNFLLKIIFTSVYSCWVYIQYIYLAVTLIRSRIIV